ncbi:MAG: TraR/DksA family transcriptional regulator [Nocardioides sp.]|uniref:TraR/DksA family transcriptional regulator n=1 Tax=Nocardioides sp. TaxID=35761 RepID=UPI003F11FDE1
MTRTPSTSVASNQTGTVTPAAARRAAARRRAKLDLSALVVGADESSWTDEEMDEVLADLGRQRERITRVIADLEHEIAGLMKDAGDGAGHDQADVGATTLERDHDITLVSTERGLLEQIDRALEHIDEGTYGVCDSCGGAIGKMRLMAFPRATLCMSCKQREERR